MKLVDDLGDQAVKRLSGLIAFVSQMQKKNFQMPADQKLLLAHYVSPFPVIRDTRQVRGSRKAHFAEVPAL